MIEFFLKNGAGLAENAEPAPPFIVQFSLSPMHVPFLREHARLVLGASGGSEGGVRFADDGERAEHFICNAVTANAHTDTVIRQELACVLLYLCTAAPERLAAIVGGTVSRVGFVLMPGSGRLRDVEAAAGKLRAPAGGGFASAPVLDGRRFLFRYVAVTI